MNKKFIFLMIIIGSSLQAGESTIDSTTHSKKLNLIQSIINTNKSLEELEQFNKDLELMKQDQNNNDQIENINNMKHNLAKEESSINEQRTKLIDAFKMLYGLQEWQRLSLEHESKQS